MKKVVKTKLLKIYDFPSNFNKNPKQDFPSNFFLCFYFPKFLGIQVYFALKKCIKEDTGFFSGF